MDVGPCRALGAGRWIAAVVVCGLLAAPLPAAAEPLSAVARGARSLSEAFGPIFFRTGNVEQAVERLLQNQTLMQNPDVQSLFQAVVRGDALDAATEAELGPEDSDLRDAIAVMYTLPANRRPFDIPAPDAQTRLTSTCEGGSCPPGMGPLQAIVAKGLMPANVFEQVVADLPGIFAGSKPAASAAGETAAHAIGEKDFPIEVVVASHQQLVLVDFWSPNCTNCVAMKPVIEALAAKRADIKVVTYNIAEHSVPNAHPVRSLPSVMIFRDGELAEQVSGGKTIDELEALLADVAAR